MFPQQKNNIVLIRMIFIFRFKLKRRAKDKNAEKVVSQIVPSLTRNHTALRYASVLHIFAPVLTHLLMTGL